MRIALFGLAAALAVASCGSSTPPTKAVADCGTPAAPANLVSSPGPGPTEASLRWDAADAQGGAPVHRYTVYRDGAAFGKLGNTLAFGDLGASGAHDYAVSATNTCGVEGAKSESVSATALPGTLVEAKVLDGGIVRPKRVSWDVYDADGELVGTRTWRVVLGLGNCCETYVAADAAGRLYEYGGTYLFVSPDEGETWTRVDNVIPNLQAEGAVVGAPGGDMLGVNWDPYTGDQLFSHKYVAATGTWYTSRTPLHQPFFDRPWVAVVEGPFDVHGLIVPYISFLMSNYTHGDIMYVSYDGLNYQVPDSSLLAQGLVPLRLEFPPDPDRDWIQSIRGSTVYPLDGGYGLRDTHNLGDPCGGDAVLTETATWSCPDWMDTILPPQAGEVVRVDSTGAIHVISVETGGRTVDHRMSSDGGKSWRTVRARLPRGLVVEDWDAQVNAAADQVAVVVHASKSADGTGEDQDLVVRITGLKDTLRVKEILLVGDGNHVFGASLASETDRFDYTTVAILPSGRVALSFGDRRRVPPAVAVETAE